MSYFTDPRDDTMYRVTQIGEQWWLAENLRYLPAVSPATTPTAVSPLYYVYDYQGCDVNAAKATANYRHYGVLYNWAAALTACPPGWHLPEDAEWAQLTDFLLANHRHLNPNNLGAALKSNRQTEPCWLQLDAPDVAAGSRLTALRRLARQLIDGSRQAGMTGEFGFAALPGGRCSYGGFYRLGALGYWWSATEASPLRAWCRQITTDGRFNRWDMNKGYGYTVRCLRD